jgi:hypothetical protein
VQFFESLDRGRTVELHSNVTCRPSHPHRGAHGATALGDNRIDTDVAAKGDTDHAGSLDTIAKEQRTVSGATCATGQPTYLDVARVTFVEPAEELFGIKGEGIGQ